MSPKLTRQQQIGEDYQTLCRLCLKKTRLKIVIYEEEGLQRDIPGKILNCLSLIVAEDDSLPKFVCVSCIDKLETFQDFRDMCHESENLLTNYVAAVEDCNPSKQHYQAVSASLSSPHLKARSRQKLDLRDQCLPPPQEPATNFVSCTVKSEPQDVPSHEETIRNASQPESSTVVKSEPMEQQIIYSVGDNSSLPFLQTDARTNTFREEGGVHLGVSGDSVQSGASTFIDSDDDIVEIVSEEVKKTEQPTESETPTVEGEMGYFFNNALLSDGTLQGTVDNQGHLQLKGAYLSGGKLDDIKIAQSRIQLRPAVSASLDLHIRDGRANVKSSKKEEKHLDPSTSQSTFPCSECSKVFIRKHNLTAHIRVHTGERRFVCATCGKAFTRKAHLNTHSRIHTGLKPYTCPVCDRSFTQSSHLRTHIVVHASKPYTCNLCLRSFNTEENLRMHSLLPHT